MSRPPTTTAERDRAQVARIRRAERIITGTIYAAIALIHVLIGAVIYGALHP